MRLYDLFRISHGRLNQFLIFIFLINLRSYHRRTPPLFIYPPRTTSSIHLIFPIDKKFLANRPQINLPRTNERINVGNLGSTRATILARLIGRIFQRNPKENRLYFFELLLKILPKIFIIIIFTNN